MPIIECEHCGEGSDLAGSQKELGIELLENNRRYAEGFEHADTPASPRMKVAVLTCMDARIDVHKIFGLQIGDAHVIRNAGGSLTEDTTRSLLVSSLLGAEEVLVVHHTDCRMRAFTEEELRAEVAMKTDAIPPFELGALPDLERSVRDAVAGIDENPLLIFERVRGYVYDVTSGLLRHLAG